MKAKIYYRRPDSTLPHNKWKYTVKTIEVSKNEPNHILQEFIKITRLPQYTYVTHIKCGRYDYQWYDSCNCAFGVGILILPSLFFNKRITLLTEHESTEERSKKNRCKCSDYY